MHGKGYIAEPIASNWDAEPVLRANGMPYRAGFGVFGYDTVTDQGSTSSCVAHAISNAIEVLTDVQPCILAIYAQARIHCGKSIEDDSGVSLKAALGAVAHHGYCPDHEWPWNPAQITEPMGWGIARATFDKIGLLWHVVETDRERTIKQAISTGRPVIIGTVVNPEFEAWDSWDIWPGCESGDGHAMMICGYDPESFWVKNSWGSSWGSRGFARISWNQLNNSHVVAVVDKA